MADADIFCAYGVLLTEKLLTKTESLLSQKYPRNPVIRLTMKSSMDIELLIQKPLTKTKSLRIKKSPKKPSSTADTEIFNGHKLLLTHKPLTETASLGPKNHQWSALLRLTLTSSTHIDYCWLRNRWRKLIPCCPKNNPRNPVPTANAEIFNGHRLLLTQKPLTRIESLEPKNHPKKPSFTTDAEIFNGHRLLLPHKPLTKIESLEPKNHPRSALLRLKLTSSTYIDYCWLRNRWWKWVPAIPKIILET